MGNLPAPLNGDHRVQQGPAGSEHPASAEHLLQAVGKQTVMWRTSHIEGQILKPLFLVYLTWSQAPPLHPVRQGFCSVQRRPSCHQCQMWLSGALWALLSASQGKPDAGRQGVDALDDDDAALGDLHLAHLCPGAGLEVIDRHLQVAPCLHWSMYPALVCTSGHRVNTGPGAGIWCSCDSAATGPCRVEAGAGSGCY